jgi:hypothetical protein
MERADDMRTAPRIPALSRRMVAASVVVALCAAGFFGYKEIARRTAIDQARAMVLPVSERLGRLMKHDLAPEKEKAPAEAEASVLIRDIENRLKSVRPDKRAESIPSLSYGYLMAAREVAEAYRVLFGFHGQPRDAAANLGTIEQALKRQEKLAATQYQLSLALRQLYYSQSALENVLGRDGFENTSVLVDALLKLAQPL